MQMQIFCVANSVTQSYAEEPQSITEFIFAVRK